MTTAEPIITPDVEALLQRYIDATTALLEAAGKPISPVELGTNLHLQMEVIVTIEHAATLLGQQLAQHEKDEATPIRSISLLSVRHSIYVGILRVLKERTAEIGRMAQRRDYHVPPGTDIPVPPGHPGIVITPMRKP